MTSWKYGTLTTLPMLVVRFSLIHPLSLKHLADPVGTKIFNRNDRSRQALYRSSYWQYSVCRHQNAYLGSFLFTPFSFSAESSFGFGTTGATVLRPLLREFGFGPQAVQYLCGNYEKLFVHSLPSHINWLMCEIALRQQNFCQPTSLTLLWSCMASSPTSWNLTLQEHCRTLLFTMY